VQKIEIFLKVKKSGVTYQTEVIADEPASFLIERLSKELGLPKTDWAGKKLVYLLRQASDGHILSERSTLVTQKIETGASLILDSFVEDGTVAELLQLDSLTNPLKVVRPSSAGNPVSSVKDAQPTRLKRPVVDYRKSRLTRRALLVVGGAITITMGYTAYRNWNMNNMSNLMSMIKKGSSIIVPVPPPVPSAITVPRSNTQNPIAAANVRSVTTFAGHQGIVRAVAWSPDGSILASGADDKLALLWGTDGVVQQKLVHTAAVLTLAWSPDSQRLVTGANNQVTFFQRTDGKTLMQLTHDGAAMVTSLAWTPHKQKLLVAGLTNSQVIVWNPTTYESLTTFTHHTSSVEGVGWDASGQTVGSCSTGGVVRVWNAVDGQELHGLYLDAQLPMNAIGFTPTGSLLAVGGNDGVVRIWNGLVCNKQKTRPFGLQCLDMPQRLLASANGIRTLAWSPDARLLAVGSVDGILTLWFPANQSQKPMMKMQMPDAIHSLSWSPDGKKLASATAHKVMIWNVTA
jgi:WD40 repeat protein